MKQLTKQEIFDKVWDRYVVKKKPLSFIRIKPSDFIYVVFYGPNDARDPMGLFIPVEEYKEEWDSISGHTVYSFLNMLKVDGKDKEPWAQIFFSNQSFFEELEKAHDDVARFVKPYRRLGAIKGRLISIAKKYKLHYAETK